MQEQQCRQQQLETWISVSASQASLPPLVKGLQTGIQLFRCAVPLDLPQAAEDFAQRWQVPGPATGGQVGEHRTSQTASQPHLGQLTQGKLREIPTDTWI